MGSGGAGPEVQGQGSPAGTLPQRVARQAATEPGAVILREKRLGLWTSITWAEVGRMTRQVAMALHALGLGKGDVTAILAANSPRWVYADLGTLSMGGISAGLHPAASQEQVARQLAGSRAKVLFAEDEEQLDKALTVRGDCPDLRKIVVFSRHGLRDFSDPDVIFFDDLLDLGAAGDKTDPDAFAQLLARAGPDDPALLIHTSGATGPVRGALISHGNIVAQCGNAARSMELTKADTRLALLPMSQASERITGCYAALWSGVVSTYVENTETVTEDLRSVQPTVLAAVPRVWEKLQGAIMMALSDATAMQRWAWRRAMSVGTAIADLELAGAPVPRFLRLKQKLAYHAVFRNIRRSMGLDRARLLWTGGAPVSKELLRWYRAHGLLMLEGYGLTETSGLAAANTGTALRPGTVGRGVPQGEVALSDEGEVLIRGPHVFMGYLDEPEATARALVDGWLHTGDMGAVDADGYLSVLGRRDDMIVTADGRRVSPSGIEKELTFSLYISDAVVVGDGRAWLAALIALDQENVEKYAQDNDISFTNFESLMQAPRIVSLMEGEVAAANARLSGPGRIERFRILGGDLAQDDGALTPAMRLNRSFVVQTQSALVESIYADD